MAPRATVDVEFSVRVTEPGPAAISIAAAHADTEQLDVSWHGESELVEFEHGTRAEVFEFPAGEHRVTYHAERLLDDPEPEPVTPAEAPRPPRQREPPGARPRAGPRPARGGRRLHPAEPVLPVRPDRRARAAG